MRIRLKRGMSIILAMLLVMGGMTGVMARGGTASAESSDFAAGDGTTAATAYEIATADQLNAVRNYSGAGVYFKLTADIDLSAYAGGAGWEPIPSFGGTMDGNGHAITGLTINRPNESNVGLFGQTDADSLIINLKLNKVNVTGYQNVAGLAGANYGAISNSSVTGIVSCNYWFAGGLVGYMLSGTISNSYWVGVVNGGYYSNSLAGYVEGVASISNSYAAGPVNGTAGQLALAAGSVRNSFYGWDSIALSPGTAVGTTQLNHVYNGMEYAVNDEAFIPIAESTVDGTVEIAAAVNDTITVRATGDDTSAVVKTLTVGENDLRWGMETIALESDSSKVTQGKVKVLKLPNGGNTVWATPGQAAAETAPAVGTAAFSGDLARTYSNNLSSSPFVTASAGQIISVVEVNESDIVVGFNTITVAAENIGTVLPLTDPGQLEGDDVELINGQYQDFYAGDLLSGDNGSELVSVESSNQDAVAASMETNWNQTHFLRLSGLSQGSSDVSVVVADKVTRDTFSRTLHVTVLNEAPYMYDDSEDAIFGTESKLSFYPTAGWGSTSITSVEVNGHALSPESYTITDASVSPFTRGTILFHAGVLTAEENEIVVKADGYVDAHASISLHRSEESFYSSAPVIDRASGGLGASINVLWNYEKSGYWHEATVVFQLMNNTGNQAVPVDTVSFTVNSLNRYQSFRAHFNLADAATNPHYSVRAFVISGDNADDDNLGFNLATEVDANTFEDLYASYLNWND